MLSHSFVIQFPLGLAPLTTHSVDFMTHDGLWLQVWKPLMTQYGLILAAQQGKRSYPISLSRRGRKTCLQLQSSKSILEFLIVEVLPVLLP